MTASRTGRGTMRRLVAALAAAAMVVACSSGSGDDDSSSGAAPPSEPTAPTRASFAVPETRLAAIEAAGLTFTEVDYPEQPDGVPWPTEEWPVGDIPEGVDATAVQSVVDQAFGELSNETGTIDAILVVQGGELVVEEYNGWDPATPHNSWSMAKSITSALVGILVGEGRLDVWEPADVPEWDAPGDPRAAITLDQLMRMSSGLAWNESYTDPAGDVIANLGTEVDRGAYTANKPLAVEPDTAFYYSTGTANLIARIVADEVGHGDDLVSWIDQAMFQPLGITDVEHSLDAAGVISGGSWINMRPQDFARFGLLYLRDGVWEGERILPEGWVDYSRMPTPTQPEGRYGALWWLDVANPGTFVASGFNGQTIMVVPEEDLVIVVLAEVPDRRSADVVRGLLDVFST